MRGLESQQLCNHQNRCDISYKNVFDALFVISPGVKRLLKRNSPLTIRVYVMSCVSLGHGAALGFLTQVVTLL